MSRGRAGRSGWLALAALSALVAVAGCHPRPKYSGWHLEPVRSAPDLPLAGAGGLRISLGRPEGRLSLVTFGYSSCPDVCPATLADWRRVRPRLGADTSRVRFVFVSVDWKHDTPELAGAFARGFDRTFIGVLADSMALGRLLPAFRAEARYDTLPNGAGLAVSHTDYTYLVDDSARVALSYDFAAKPENLARDVRLMIAARRLAAR